MNMFFITCLFFITGVFAQTPCSERNGTTCLWHGVTVEDTFYEDYGFCYLDGTDCFDALDDPTCADDDPNCADCKSKFECLYNENLCSWDRSTLTCSNAPRTCDDTYCSSCDDQDNCYDLSGSCAFSNPQCFDDSCSTDPRVVSSSTHPEEYSSFDIHLNGDSTTYSGYYSEIKIGSNFASLKPGVTQTIGNVAATLRVLDDTCNKVVVKWEVVNSGLAGTTVGVCLYADSLIDSSETVLWNRLPDNHGVHANNTDLYIQSSEAFTGVFAGDLDGSKCYNLGFDLPEEETDGISFSWREVYVGPSSTRTFELQFTNSEENYLTCSSGSDPCSACTGYESCYSHDSNCYYSDFTCKDSNAQSSCNSTGTSCYGCKTEDECTEVRPANCTWISETKSCSLRCGDVEPSLTSTTPYYASNSFEILLSSETTTNFGQGFVAVAKIDGSYTSALIPDVPVTSASGVKTTLKVLDEDCNTVVVEWVLDNTRGTVNAVVGACLRADTMVKNEDANHWVALSEMHGLYTTDSGAQFYIQADESFTGLFAGDLPEDCELSIVNVPAGGADRIAMNWNGFTVNIGDIKTFRLTFSNTQKSFPASCSAGDPCSNCATVDSCYSLTGANCYYSSGACYDAGSVPSCTVASSWCGDCKTSSECTAANSHGNCAWEDTYKSCSCAAPNLVWTAPGDPYNSFEIQLNGGQTTNNGDGYYSLVKVGTTESYTLQLGVPETDGATGVKTTMSAVTTDCGTVTVEWMVDNSAGGAPATVGIVLAGDLFVNSNNELYTALPGNRGLHCDSTPFYIQSNEAFSGIYAGLSSGHDIWGTVYDINNFVTNHMSVNWQGVVVNAGDTKVFRLTFSTLEDEIESEKEEEEEDDDDEEEAEEGIEEEEQEEEDDEEKQQQEEEEEVEEEVVEENQVQEEEEEEEEQGLEPSTPDSTPDTTPDSKPPPSKGGIAAAIVIPIVLVVVGAAVGITLFVLYKKGIIFKGSSGGESTPASSEERAKTPPDTNAEQPPKDVELETTDNPVADED